MESFFTQKNEVVKREADVKCQNGILPNLRDPKQQQKKLTIISLRAIDANILFQSPPTMELGREKNDWWPSGNPKKIWSESACDFPSSSHHLYMT